MRIVIILCLVCIFIMSTITGIILNRKLASKIKKTYLRLVVISVLRTTFYCPTVVVQSFYITPLPTIIAVPLQFIIKPTIYSVSVLLIPVLFFIISLLSSLIKVRKKSHLKDEETEQKIVPILGLLSISAPLVGLTIPYLIALILNEAGGGKILLVCMTIGSSLGILLSSLSAKKERATILPLIGFIISMLIVLQIKYI